MCARGALSIVTALLALVAAGAVGDRIAGDPGSASEEELPFFPSGRVLGFVSLGQPTAAADLAWCAAIQYYGKHHLGDRRYPLAGHLFDVTTRLDPRFQSAYAFGALVLGEEAGDMSGARALLARGIAADPKNWMLPFHRGFLEYMHGDPVIGAVEMQRASAIQGAPPYAGRLAAHACGKVGKRELAVRLWEAMAKSPDPGQRALAEERLRDLRGGVPPGSRTPRRTHVVNGRKEGIS
jgi:hypothetical protein